MDQGIDGGGDVGSIFRVRVDERRFLERAVSLIVPGWFVDWRMSWA